MSELSVCMPVSLRMEAKMAKKNDPQNEPHVQDIENDPAPTKGTNEPWKRPGQASQNPDETIADKDLDKWKKVVDKHGN